MKTIVTKNGTYRQINVKQARELFAAGQPVYMCSYRTTPARWNAGNHVLCDTPNEPDLGVIFDRMTCAYLTWLKDTHQGTRLHYYMGSVRIPSKLMYERTHNLPLALRKTICLLMEHIYTKEDIQLALMSRACDLEETIDIEWI